MEKFSSERIFNGKKITEQTQNSLNMIIPRSPEIISISKKEKELVNCTTEKINQLLFIIDDFTSIHGRSDSIQEELVDAFNQNNDANKVNLRELTDTDRENNILYDIIKKMADYAAGWLKL